MDHREAGGGEVGRDAPTRAGFVQARGNFRRLPLGAYMDDPGGRRKVSGGMPQERGGREKLAHAAVKDNSAAAVLFSAQIDDYRGEIDKVRDHAGKHIRRAPCGSGTDQEQLASDGFRAIVEPVSRLLTAARSCGAPVIYVCDWHAKGDTELAHLGEHAMQYSHGAKIIPELTPHPGEAMVRKATFDRFFVTDLERLLQRGADASGGRHGVHGHRNLALNCPKGRFFPAAFVKKA